MAMYNHRDLVLQSRSIPAHEDQRRGTASRVCSANEPTRQLWVHLSGLEPPTVASDGIGSLSSRLTKLTSKLNTAEFTLVLDKEIARLRLTALVTP